MSDSKNQPLEFFLNKVKIEHNNAISQYPAFHSMHEGYAVLAEEVDELWDIVRQKDAERDLDHAYQECIQIAAMAMRFATECC